MGTGAGDGAAAGLAAHHPYRVMLPTEPHETLDEHGAEHQRSSAVASPYRLASALTRCGQYQPTDGGQHEQHDVSTEIPELGTIDMKLEVVTLPVSDVERTKRFYQDLGWRMDADLVFGDDVRAV